MAFLQLDHDFLPVSAVLAASGDYKATDPTAHTVSCRGATALTVTLDVTAVSGGGGVTVTIKGYDEASDKYTTILASALVTATGQTQYVITPWYAAVANVSAQKHLPPKVQVTLVGSGTRTTLTYSASVFLSN